MVCMFNFIRKTFLWVILGGILWLCSTTFIAPINTVTASDFLVDFWQPLLTEGGRWDERAYRIDWLTDDASLLDNLKTLFYPDFTQWWWALWDLLKNIGIWLLILMFIRAWAKLAMFWHNEEDRKEWLLNILYLIIWAIIFFFAVWLVSEWLNFGWIDGITGEDWLIKAAEDNVLLVLLWLLKWIAFFAALIFIVYYWYQMITAFDAEDKLKAARTWILNVIVALLFIKIIDYIYFIVLKADFKEQAITLIVWISKFLWYVLWMVAIVMIIYAWFLMVTANWDDDQVTKAKNLVRTIFISLLVLMLFLLIIYQIFKDVL